jgi:hypothetical protein
MGGERGVPAAPPVLAAGESAETSTGLGRIVTVTRWPADSAVASAVASWAMIVVSPRSTVTRLLAPRNVVAITVPASGPASAASPEATATASGRTSATTGPAGTPVSTSGRVVPRTTTVPEPVTSPASRLDRPTNSATNGVAGRE